MSGSRRILLALLLASVTCVLVVQVTMDNWNSREPLTSYADNVLKSEQSQFSGPSARLNLSTKPDETRRKLTFPDTSSVTPKRPSTPKMSFKTPKKALPTVKIRRLSLNRRSKQHLLISRNERMQEILKQSGSIRGRPNIDSMRTLKSIPLADTQKVNRIIIVTYFRSGSSFVGDLLQQNWKTFYQFEPLHSMTYDSRIGDDKFSYAFKLLDGLFRCNYTDLKEYISWVSKPRNQFLFAHNNFLWATCRSSIKTCFNSSFVEAVCQRAPVHVMKVTRLHMRHLRSFIERNQDLNVKIVFLTRDPRGILSSRWNLEWCNDTQCNDPAALCHEMDEDIEIFEELRKKDPSKFIKIRYEDMSLNPEAETKYLFEFLDLPFSQSVKRFLKTHTVSRRTDSRNPYSTRRNTTAMAFSWRERFSFDQVVRVQSACSNVMQNLNHSLITSPSQLPFPQGVPKKNDPIKPVPKKVRSQESNYAKKLSNGELDGAASLTSGTALTNKPSINSNSAEITPERTAAVSLQNRTKSLSIPLNNTKIEVHKAYYALPNLSPKLESIQVVHQGDPDHA